MEFNRTKAFIEELEKKDGICIDELISVISDLFLDAGKAGRPEKLPVSENSNEAKREFTGNLYKVSEKIVNVYDNKKNLNIPANADLRAAYTENEENLKTAQNELKEIEKSIKDEEDSRKRLENEKSNLKKKKKDLLAIQEACKALREEIDELSDPALEKIADENKRLTEELEARTTRYQSLIEEKNRINGDIITKDNDIKAVEAEITEMEKTKSEKDAEYSGQLEKKKELDGQIEEYKKKIDECSKYIEEFPVKTKGIEAKAKELEDLKNGTLVILNGAIKTALGDELLKAELINVPGTADSIEKITEAKLEKAEDIEKIAESLKEGAERRVEAMAALLRAINESAKMLTEPGGGSAK